MLSDVIKKCRLSDKNGESPVARRLSNHEVTRNLYEYLCGKEPQNIKIQIEYTKVLITLAEKSNAKSQKQQLLRNANEI